jgi:hypothetical protein
MVIAKMNRIVVLMGVGMLLGAQTACSGENDLAGRPDPGSAYDLCSGRASTVECTAYARRQGAVIYVKSDTKGKVLDRADHGIYILLTESAKEADKAEWIRTYTVLDNPDPKAKKKTKAYFGYVRRTDVILDTDFRKVVGCWPVKYALVAEEAAGDFEPHGVWFSTSGLARGPDGRDFGEQHTYYAEGVFTVRHPKYANLHLYGHGTIDYEKRIAKYMGTVVLKENESVPGVEWFTPADLKGCKAIPTIDPDSRAPNPKE